MMQAFYWESDQGTEGARVVELSSEKVESLEKAGINALWLPPICEGCGGAISAWATIHTITSTWAISIEGRNEDLYGNREELENLIASRTSTRSGLCGYGDQSQLRRG